MSEPERYSREATKTFKEGEACERIHLWLYSRDIEWIKHNTALAGKVPLSQFVRLAVRQVIKGIEAQTEQIAQPVGGFADEQGPSE